MQEKSNRLKSPVVWASVVAQIVLIVALYKPEISENIKIIATALIEILTTFGILNNPSDSKNF